MTNKQKLIHYIAKNYNLVRVQEILSNDYEFKQEELLYAYILEIIQDNDKKMKKINKLLNEIGL